MSKKFDVYGIGNAIMDLQLAAQDSDLEILQLEKAAMKLCSVEEQERLIDFFPGQWIAKSSGGSAANTMITLAQLGGRGVYSSLVAQDEFGQIYMDEMRELGVTLHNDPIAEGVTGTSIILITPDSERTMNTHLGVNVEFSARYVSDELIAQSEWVYIEGYKFTDENGQGAIDYAVECAKRHGAKIAVTFSDGFIVDFFHGPLRKAVQSADLVFANSRETCRYVGSDDEERAFQILCEAAPNCVMTRSEKGAWVSYGGEITQIDPYVVDSVDDTGAGDTFAGAFLYGITHGMNGVEAGKLACFLASRVVSQLGARLRLPVQEICRSEGLIS